MAHEPDDAVEVLRSVWAVRDRAAPTSTSDCGPHKACKNMKDVSFDGMAEPGSDLEPGVAGQARARGQAEHVRATASATWSSAARRPADDARRCLTCQPAAGEESAGWIVRRPSAG